LNEKESNGTCTQNGDAVCVADFGDINSMDCNTQRLKKSGLSGVELIGYWNYLSAICPQKF
jgi:hypothetical protein